MAEEFTFKTDDDLFPFLPMADAKGIRFSRFGLIQAEDPVKALNHASVPKIGDAWQDGSFIFVRSKRVVEKFAGREGSAVLPTYRLEIVYETPTWSGAGVLRPAKPDDAWTELTSGNASLTVYRDVGVIYPEGQRIPPIGGGDGAARDVGIISATVKKWYDKAGFEAVDIGRLVTMNQVYVNREPVTLPALMGSGTHLTLAEKQVRYLSFELLREGEFWGIAHKLSLARDHLYREYTKDEDGKYGNEYTERVLYEPTDFGGLW